MTRRSSPIVIGDVAIVRSRAAIGRDDELPMTTLREEVTRKMLLAFVRSDTACEWRLSV